MAKTRINLKLFRIRRNLTQADMAERVGYARDAYNAIESGKRNPSIDFFTALQIAFSIPNENMWELTLLEEYEES